MKARVGILLISHGAVTRIEDIPEYYAHIRGGAIPSPKVLETLKERYRAIGGSSPLNSITLSTADKLQRELDARFGRERFIVNVGFRHVTPFIGETLAHLAEEGINDAIAIPMSPHVSKFVREGYSEAISRAGTEITLRLAGHWHMEPSLLQYWVQAVTQCLEKLPGAKLIFTAHSLPRRWLEGDDIPGRLRESGEWVAREAGVPKGRRSYCWQSASMTGEEWLGPDVYDEIISAARQGERAIVLCPQGFIADHLETLYDLDVMGRRVAEERGLRFLRTPVPNDSPLLVTSLINVVVRQLVLLDQDI